MPAHMLHSGFCLSAPYVIFPSSGAPKTLCSSLCSGFPESKKRFSDFKRYLITCVKKNVTTKCKERANFGNM